jgi:uncharacterized membrane protein YhhN
VLAQRPRANDRATAALLPLTTGARTPQLSSAWFFFWPQFLPSRELCLSIFGYTIFTPLATTCILALAVSNWRASRKSYALSISVGLFVSLLGDIALLRAEEYFLSGLVAFLFAHIAYLLAFTRDTEFPARWSVCFLYLFVAAILYLFLFPRLPVALKLPVAVYAILLTSMAGQAMGRYLVVRSRIAKHAANGALLFMLSDVLPAIDRFRAPLPRASLLILVPYFLGQWLIALSTSKFVTR